MDMEIRWFKETDCVCLFKKGQVIKGKGYENRASLLPKELKRGKQKMECGAETENGRICCFGSAIIIILPPGCPMLLEFTSCVVEGFNHQNPKKREMATACSSKRAVANFSGFTVPCHLSPEISAVDMEIRWFKETDCVRLYKNRHMIEGRSYEGTVKQFTDVLEKGDVSISLTRFSVSDLGDYVCQVTSGGRT
ncbi:hypothetical protein E1301_Tti008907 [Triplophysa tibetana]|uniref:Ig-like domain-containing protein n=1 Tax=Triplophysa tibetana TaxID=1572043 RepID=A0A5A9P4J6_9TELE|nr:hypothetical protein E1301_Tti008907 [Triplophysa tibetana]